MTICKECINHFVVKQKSDFDEILRLHYCKHNVYQDFEVLDCPYYKPKVDVDKMKAKLKEEPKHIKRIERQRVRFNGRG